MRDRKYRVILKDGRYFPQKLFCIKLLKIKKWKYFTEEVVYLICYGYAEGVTERVSFDTKQDARNYLRNKGLKL